MKKKLSIAIFILLVGFSIGIFIYDISKNKENTQNNISQNDKILELINNINEINKIFNSKEFNNINFYESKYGMTCKEYIGDDIETYIELLKNTYVNPFFEDGYFQMVYDDKNKEKLFICNPECNIITYNTENSKIIEANGKKYLNANNNEIELIEDDNYKLSYPLVGCE